MRYLPIALLGASLLVPSSSQAQQWTQPEQEILDFTTACWESWSQEMVDRYLSDCWHEDITFWWSGNHLPFGARWVDRAASWWFGLNDWGAWDIQPHTIKIYGDAAVIQYQLLVSSELSDGRMEFYSGGRTDFLVREAGSWKVVAVHEHGVPTTQ